MSSRNTWKARDKEIKFRGGPRDNNEITWTHPQDPLETMYYHSDGDRYEYKMVMKYQDDNEVVYYYIYTGKVTEETQ